MIEIRKDDIGEEDMSLQQIVFDTLHTMDIAYELQEHQPVYTMDEMDALGIDRDGTIVKNLFLCDAKGKKHFLLVLKGNKRADLKAIREKIGSTPLRFASEERLFKHMKLSQGSVSPFGVLHNQACDVTVVFDEDLKNERMVGVHPNDNRATVWLSFSDLVKVVEKHGNPILYVYI